MKILLNYLGQLRLYSLVDLALLLVALNTGQLQFIGAIFLHVSFLAYLESRHSHAYRAKVPRWISYVLGIIGLVIFGKIEGIFYIVTSYLYTKKTKKLGWLSPFSRAFQNLFIVAGIVGYSSPLAYVVAIIFFVRNFVGDLRDVEKDRLEGVRTIPVILGAKKSIPYVHLLTTIFTSFIWWSLSPISIIWLILVVIVQICSYNLTPR